MWSHPRGAQQSTGGVLAGPGSGSAIQHFRSVGDAGTSSWRTEHRAVQGACPVGMTSAGEVPSWGRWERMWVSAHGPAVTSVKKTQILLYNFKHGTILHADTAETGLLGPAILRPPPLVSFPDTKVPLNGIPLAHHFYLRFQSMGDVRWEAGSVSISESLPTALCPSSHVTNEPGLSDERTRCCHQEDPRLQRRVPSLQPWTGQLPWSAT